MPMTLAKYRLQVPVLEVPEPAIACTFAAPPKCGCTWMVSALGEAGVATLKWDSANVHLPGNREGIPSVTIRRHPCDWLRSYWANMRGRLARVPQVDAFQFPEAAWRTLDAFVEHYLANMPGAVSRMFSAYSASIVLDLDETLPQQVADVLDQCGVIGYDREALRRPPANVTPNKAAWTPELYDKVLEIDGAVCPAG